MMSTNTDKEETRNISTERNTNSAEKNINDEQLDRHKCHQCHRDFKTNRGLLQHQRTYKVTFHIISNNAEDTQTTAIEKQNVNDYERNTSGVVITSPMINQRDNLEPPAESDFTLVWGNHSSGDLKQIINACYEEIVHFHKNLFLP